MSYYSNAGGCFGDPNPYYCVYVQPGPIHIPAAPGRYRIRIAPENAHLPGGNFVVWDGDASGGTAYRMNPSNTNIVITHVSGEITLYHYDWYPWDNSPAAVWTVFFEPLKG